MRANCTTAQAHPNIALLKYWGKQDAAGNIPAAPSLSITLDGLRTLTSVSEAREDAVRLNGAPVQDRKILRALKDWRRDCRIPPLAIDTRNNFPTAAGLASSASGFAALATAVDAHCGLGLTAGERSALARRASASAARSIHGGFVALGPPDWQAAPLLAARHWPLKVVIAIVCKAPKAISSTEGMQISRRTSPYFDAWKSSAERDCPAMREALRQKDFQRLAALAEGSCLRMHAVMLSSEPALIYWNAATLGCLHAIRSLREGGCQAFFTVDAGPQVKAVCEPEDAPRVQRALADVPGVAQTRIVGLGDGAKVIEGPPAAEPPAGPRRRQGRTS